MKSEYKIITDIIEANTRVLDVGCDDGTLMEFLKKNKNVDIRGIEISKEKVQTCISKGLTVIEGNAELDLKQFPNDSFDYVVLGQTLQAFVNPEIVWKANEDKTYEEGCLSVPNQFAEINRPKQCHVKFIDYFGQPQLLKAEGLLATCIQHEIDHLEGILFIDYLSKLKKTMIIKKLSKQKGKSERIVV